ncbi:hypothetical protein HMPREF0733_11166 [Rothia dentocariosa ATCC 17931]|uniref:Uncharacterized protein n=1 Tax=Rothia dentocariosa (strain ATCC 17931 / CDC X599 / XDIA) TaxID=762948 RepID=E3H4C0_ROTDC|nr:hypothetical protein HMPREF0733_11166 [Rothia dentocariosa ATCC 17931]
MTSEYVCEHKIRRLRYENTLKVQDAHSEHLRVHRLPGDEGPLVKRSMSILNFITVIS